MNDILAVPENPVHYRLVIGCHENLEKYVEHDINNGKTLITKLIPGVEFSQVNAEKTMPSDLKEILHRSKSHVILVFVGHSGNKGNLKLMGNQADC